jgi:hypothetical protein
MRLIGKTQLSRAEDCNYSTFVNYLGVPVTAGSSRSCSGQVCKIPCYFRC